MDHIEHHGRAVFEQACRLDLEGIVAKPKHAPYIADVKKPAWIKDQESYPQSEGRPTGIVRAVDSECMKRRMYNFARSTWSQALMGVYGCPRARGIAAPRDC